MTFTEELYRALKLVQQALDEGAPAAMRSRSCARAAHEWYEKKFGQGVREAIGRVERGAT